MAYNSGFPASYQPFYQQYSMPAPVQQPQQSNGIIWVQGEAGAKSYLVAPNNTVQLWDSESQTIYLKSADASGMPSMRVLDYTIRSNTPNPTQSVINGQNADIPTRQELTALQMQIDAMKQQIEMLGGKHDEPALQSVKPTAAEQPDTAIHAV